MPSMSLVSFCKSAKLTSTMITEGNEGLIEDLHRGCPLKTMCHDHIGRGLSELEELGPHPPLRKTGANYRAANDRHLELQGYKVSPCDYSRIKECCSLKM